MGEEELRSKDLKTASKPSLSPAQDHLLRLLITPYLDPI
jgi:hypothetical protein